MNLAASSAGLRERYYHLFRLIWFISACVAPLSVRIYFPNINMEVLFPVEPLMGILLIMFIIACASKNLRPDFPKGFFSSRTSILVLSLMASSFVSLVFSTNAVVSLKAVLVQVVYICIYYFTVSSSIFGDPRIVWKRAFLMYGGSFLPVMFFAMAMQATLGFDRAGSNRSAFPFFTDHTMYSAALTFVLLAFIFQMIAAFGAKPVNGRRISFVLLSVICALALFLGYCRAAWLAFGAIVLIGSLLWLRSWKVVAVALIAAGTLALMLFGRAGASLPNASANGAGIKEMFLSMANTHTDPSNMERLDRWHGALLMAMERPFTGFGPGTFQFSYRSALNNGPSNTLSTGGPMNPDYITRDWSVGNSVMVRSNPQVLFKNGGTAHSEYLLALSEMGFPGAMAFTLLVAATIYSGIRLMRKKSNARGIEAMALAALTAYAIHGVFNNFLDDAKVAFLFWGCVSIIGSAQRKATDC